MISNDGWLQGALHCPSPNFNDRPETDIDLLVLHNISLPPGQFGGGYIRDFFLNCLDTSAHPYFVEIAHLQVSAHVLIDRQGNVTQFVAFDKRAWHAGLSSWQGRGNCNDYSIGIELEGADDQCFTEAQYSVLLATVGILQDRYPALVRERIVAHSAVSPGRKTDPGPCFEWRRLDGCRQVAR
jgi:AmpD protein